MPAEQKCRGTALKSTVEFASDVDFQKVCLLREQWRCFGAFLIKREGREQKLGHCDSRSKRAVQCLLLADGKRAPIAVTR
jgi:hypothetical protein